MTPDVLVIGAGPAGTAAAIRASECNRSVVVLDDNPAPGGQIWRGGNASPWLRRLAAARLEILTGAQVLSAVAGSRSLLIEQAGEPREIRFRKLIIATGARELFLPFPGWTLPGVMGVGGLQALAKSGMPLAGKRIVVAGSGPLLLAVAAHLKEIGAHVLLIAEQAARRSVMRFALGLWRYPGKIKEAIALRASLGAVPYEFGCAVISASGQRKLESVKLIQGGKTRSIACDYAAVAYGLYPNIELAAALGCAVSERAVSVDERQQSSVDDVFCAGECTGVGGVDLSVIEGQIAGYAAGGDDKSARSFFPARSKARRFADMLTTAFALRPELKRIPQADTIVCRCEDVTLSRLQTMASFRAAKLHTRCGMGSCQGRVCGPAVHLLFGWKTDTVRPPIFPASIGSLIRSRAEDPSPVLDVPE